MGLQNQKVTPMSIQMRSPMGFPIHLETEWPMVI
jgi:hypothetical protein